MLPFLIKLKNLTFDILFPPLCINCRQHLNNRNKFLCDNCYSLIKLNNTLFCPDCRARLAENKQICHHAFYLLAAAGNYSDPILQNLIHYFKYESFENLTPILGGLLLKYLIENCKLKIENFIVIPVPLHRQRERQRGFNQAELLAKFVSVHLNLELVDALKRIKDTASQSKTKNYEERHKNIANCFKIKNHEFINGKNTILIDDVFTSGATINEAVRVLKSGGAKKIIALVLAKA